LGREEERTETRLLLLDHHLPQFGTDLWDHRVYLFVYGTLGRDEKNVRTKGRRWRTKPFFCLGAAVSDLFEERRRPNTLEVAGPTSVPWSAVFVR
jgi:hypothetical protein